MASKDIVFWSFGDSLETIVIIMLWIIGLQNILPAVTEAVLSQMLVVIAAVVMMGKILKGKKHDNR